MMLITGDRDPYMGRQWTETNWFTIQGCKILAELGKICYDQMFPELKKKKLCTDLGYIC
jgi:hypothetical protein